jgi:cobalt/nickel transport system permease protein
VSEQSFLDRRRGGGFFERQIASLLGVMEYALCAERLAQAPGLLQRFDPRVRLVGMLVLIACAVSVRSLPTLYGLFGAAVVLALLSRIPLAVLARGVWLNVILFTGVLALPAIFLVPGDAVFRLPLTGWAATAQGLESAAFLFGRATTAATFAALTILATPWPHLLKALRSLRLSAVLIVILGMCYRYIFLLLQTALDMFDARRSRQVGRLSGQEKRRLLVSEAGVLLSKSLHLADEVFLAMQSRGYRGEQHALLEFRMATLDWAALAGLLAVAGLVLRFQS